MTQTNKEKLLWYVAGFLATLALVLFISQHARKAVGSAPSGLPATVASSTSMTVENILTLPRVGSVIAATSTACSSRIVTTKAQPIVLVFSQNQNRAPSNLIGHLQVASTTIAYDGGIYGCGQIRAVAYDATSTISVTEL